ncbi:hypothetical protein M422DRAFT_46348 [Sphaerobolus stellatus SS14]|uniref:Unplaced genomic scaffold SPHSTscaffold_34, whole genome shotgun sequence n=1 Tax=Sphaerobolus stellatus (strain SS14) TaxID=990650 RepID=A0A0C9VGA7_SPHS4|nr:hypothetical protein M422DRAFT_46348 [Sphaerobolus stellatus SS14]
MALVPPRYRAYIPSLPNYDPDPPVQQRSPAFLPFRVGGIPVDDHSCLSEEASAGSQGFERFITPLLEFDWNEPWNTIPNVLRWIAPFLKSTQQSVLSLFCFLYLVILTRSIRENPPDMSEIGLLAEMYLKGIILLIESLYMGRLFFENYATNAAWYFDRRRVREKYTLVIGENEGGPWKIAMALSKGASDSFALAQGHADALRAQFEWNYNWTQIPPLTSEEHPCYLPIRKVLEPFSGPSFEKLRTLSCTWNRLWHTLKFPGSVPLNIHDEDIGAETLKLWYDGDSYTSCELLYHQIIADVKAHENIDQELWNDVANWINKKPIIYSSRILSNYPFTYPIWSEVFFGDKYIATSHS